MIEIWGVSCVINTNSMDGVIRGGGCMVIGFGGCLFKAY